VFVGKRTRDVNGDGRGRGRDILVGGPQCVGRNEIKSKAYLSVEFKVGAAIEIDSHLEVNSMNERYFPNCESLKNKMLCKEVPGSSFC